MTYFNENKSQKARKILIDIFSTCYAKFFLSLNKVEKTKMLYLVPFLIGELLIRCFTAIFKENRDSFTK